MTVKIHKWFWAWNYDKEEAWLNQMSQQGWQLVGVGLATYYFAQGEPGEYLYCIELLSQSCCSKESQDYISFVEDTGAETAGIFKRWVYFRQKAEKGEFELYSDNSSKRLHLNRILRLLAVLGVLELVCGGYNVLVYFLLEGLWENLFLGLFCILFALFIAYGFVRIWNKKNRIMGS